MLNNTLKTMPICASVLALALSSEEYCSAIKVGKTGVNRNWLTPVWVAVISYSLASQ